MGKHDAEDTEFHYALLLLPVTASCAKCDTLMDLLRDSRERSLQVDGRRKIAGGHRKIRGAESADASRQAGNAPHIEDVEKMLLKEVRFWPRWASYLR